MLSSKISSTSGDRMARLPSFSALCAFEAAARLGSFKHAASELNLSTSAISHQIRTLEEQLGVTLFNRSHNAVSLSDNGAAYYREVEPALSRVENATRTFTDRRLTERLRVSLLSSLSTLWLIPKLDNFHTQHPEIKLELQEDLDEVDFRDNSVDAALRYDFHAVGQWKGLVSVPLVEEIILPVCSSLYLKQAGPLTLTSQDLQLNLLVNNKHPDEWDKWFASINCAFRTEDFKSVSVMDTSNMTLTAAASGLGIALGRTPFVNQLVESGQLVRAHDKVQNRGIRNFLVYPESTSKLAQILEFSEWLQGLETPPVVLKN